MDVDPAASMRVWAFDVELGGRVFEIPALPACDWFLLLRDGDLMRILDLIQDADLDGMILSGEITTSGLEERLTQVVEEVSGRTLNATMVLVQSAVTLWPTVGGELSRRGFQWDQAPFSAALDAIYTTIMERLKTENVGQFQALLDSHTVAPKTGQARKVDRKKAMSDFEKMAGPKPEPSNVARSERARPRTQRQPLPHRQRAR